MMMKKLLNEPLFVFLLISGAMFLLFQQLSQDSNLDKTEVIVTQARVQALTFGFEKLWQRPPNAKELDALIKNYVREEIYYREAMAMGLDQNDGIVRRRLQQKMEFISHDLANLDKPDEQQLEMYLELHKEDYRQPTRLSFRQIYFNVSQRGEAARSDAKALLAILREQDTSVVNMGDPIMLKQQYNVESEKQIQNLLGAQFLQALRDTPAGSWQGPITSSYGIHLVYIEARIDGAFSALKDVREKVIRDLAALKRKQSNDDFYNNMRKRYKVVVETIESENELNKSSTQTTMKNVSL